MEFITMTRNAARVWNDHLDAVAALAWAANTAAFEAQAKVVAETYEDCLWMAIDLTARGEAADLTAAVEAIVGDAMPDTFKAEMVRRAEGIKHEAGNLI